MTKEGSSRNYLRGRSREYSIKNKLIALGYQVLRMSGSHGFADLVAIDKTARQIIFIQVKPKKYNKKRTVEIEQENNFLNDEFVCSFKVVSSINELNLNGGTK
jgi:Holliday junction resolvase